MYKDAARFKVFKETGEFPPVTRYICLESLRTDRCAKISLLIGAVCGATSLGIISLHLGRYGRLSLSSMNGIGYIISSFSCGFILSLLGVKLSPELDILKRRKGGDEASESKGLTAEAFRRLIESDVRLICLSIADPATIKNLVIRLTGEMLSSRKRRFQVKPYVLFVFD